jgi:mRNA-degrading endonuclease RelE of RelBE toxin-antitoxin system
VTEPAPHELVLTPPAVRAVQAKLPETVAAAVVEFMTGALIENPTRVGKPLRGDLSGIHSARRGTYRVLYRINDERHEVVVLRIDHRQGVYRPS